MGTDGGVHLVLHCLEQRMWHTRLTPQRFHTRERQGKLPSAQMLQHGTKRIMVSEHHLRVDKKCLQCPRAKTVLFQPLFFSQFFTSSVLQTKKLPGVGGFTYSPDVSGFKKCNPKMMGCQDSYSYKFFHFQATLLCHKNPSEIFVEVIAETFHLHEKTCFRLQIRLREFLEGKIYLSKYFRPFSRSGKYSCFASSAFL